MAFRNPLRSLLIQGSQLATNAIDGKTIRGATILNATTVTNDGEFVTTDANGFRIVQGNYGLIFRSDGGNVWMLATAAGDQYGSWGATRPIAWSLATGLVNLANGVSIMGHSPVVDVANSGQVRLGNKYTSVGTNASGYATVTHGWGFTPSVVLVTMASNAYQCATDNYTSTTYRIRVLNSSGGAQNGLDASHFALGME